MSHQGLWLTVGLTLGTTSACSAPSLGVRPPRPLAVRVDVVITAPRPSLPPPWRTPTPPSCPARAASDATRAYLVASAEAGLREIAPDGTVLRRLSHTPAAFARYVGEPATAVVFLVPERDEVRSLSLADCTEHTVATLPRDLGLACGGVWDRPYDPIDAVQSQYDVAVDPADPGALCVGLMDRNVNMANVAIALRVDLARGALSHQVTLGAPCAPAAGVAPRDQSACAALLRTTWTLWSHRAGGPPQPGDRSTPFGIERESVVRRGVDRRHDQVAVQLAATDLREETVSPSGRYAVVSANRDVGDVVYRDVILFDRQEGTFHALRPSATWPAPLTAAQLGDDDALRDLWLRISGETLVRWLGDDDRLDIGGLLVDPGHAIVRLDGELAI